MKWVTRKQIRVNRVATAWLIRRFIDPQAEFIFVEPTEVVAVQDRENARGFDAPGATYPHKDDKAVALSKRWSKSIAQMTSCFEKWRAWCAAPTLPRRLT